MSSASLRVAAFLFLATSLTGIATSCGSKTAQTTKPVKTQSTPPALVPYSIAFWDAEHGLIGSGITWRKTGGAISATSDGGKTFRVVLRTPGPVEWVSTAGSSDAWALVERCTPDDCEFSRLLHSSNRGKSWQRSSAIVWNPSYATPEQGFALASIAVKRRPYLRYTGPLVKTSDGGHTWTRQPAPCAGSRESFGGPFISFPSPRRIWMVCVSQPGAGNREKTVYASSNGGRSWRKLVDVAMTSPSAGLSSYGYPQGISFSPQGYGLLWESRGNLYLTRDGGRHWRTLGVARAEVDSGLSAAMLSKTNAFVLLGYRYRLLSTADGGRSWTVVHRWAAPR